jgi:aryl-alcohol dehydrogenase-like predicted oxidoreductase
VPVLGSSDIAVSRLCLGANVFGWTADRDASWAVLDAFAEAGGTFVDTADSYTWRAPGNSGGESETIIGDWMAARGNRDRVVVATKVGSLPGRPGLSAANIAAAAEDSLRRLRTDRIDLYYAHRDDPGTPQEEYLAAFDALVRAGKVRAVGASNFTADRLRSALRTSEREGLAAFVALQPHYNLLERAEFETSLAPVLAEEGLACVPYFGLARGFLTGKYRPGGPEVDSPRAAAAKQYLDYRGLRALNALEEVAAERGAPVAAVALAWLAQQPTVAAPIASARSPQQLADLLPVLELALGAEELDRLSAAAPVPDGVRD